MDSKEVEETLSAAYDYLERLKKLKQQVETAEAQVNTTAEETENKIETIFSNLIENINRALLQRKQHLLDETKKIKSRKTKPLQECQGIISSRLNVTRQCIKEGDQLLSSKQLSLLDNFAANARSIGCLPAVPDLTDVPLVTLQVDANIEDEILKMCSSLGTVFHTPPVQISSMTENPGAILVEWQNVEEQLNDIQEFRLQRAFGNVLTDKHLTANFVDCYTGPETQHLVKDVRVNQQYSFRVCCKFEGAATWSPWSLTQVAMSTIEPFHWRLTEGFLLTNEQKIATPNDDSQQLLLVSDGAQFRVGFSIEFTFLSCDDNTSEQTCVGLSYNKISNFDEDEIFYVNAEGAIFVNGTKKSTVLPKIRKGSKVSFTCNLINESKIRLNVDSSEKRVTYDWIVPNEKCFYFFCKFGSVKWKIMVE